jgi:hypothetical protein
MSKRNKKRQKHQPNQSKVQTSPNRSNSAKPKSRFAHFLDERNKRIKRFTSGELPTDRVSLVLAFFMILMIWSSWAAFSDRLLNDVPAWLALLLSLAILIVAITRIYWLIFIPDSRIWLRSRELIEWAFVSIALFFYFYGTGAYYVTLDIVSTRVLPFLSRQINEVITNLFGWIMSGILGNAAYDGIKKIVNTRKKSEQPK